MHQMQKFRQLESIFAFTYHKIKTQKFQIFVHMQIFIRKIFYYSIKSKKFSVKRNKQIFLMQYFYGTKYPNPVYAKLHCFTFKNVFWTLFNSDM